MAMSLRKKSLIGLDIGAYSLKLAEVSGTREKLTLSKWGMRELPPEAIVGGEFRDRDLVLLQLQNLIDQCNVKTKDVVFSISGHGVITDRLIMDYKSGEEAEQAILFEAEQRSPFDTEDVTLDYNIVHVEEDKSKMVVVIVAARNEILNSYLELLGDAGLNPVIIDVDAFALLNAYEVNYQVDVDRILALVNIGFDSTNITFIKDGVYHSMRDLASGGRMFFESISKELNLSPELTEKVLRGEVVETVDPDMLKAIIASTGDELAVDIEVAFSYFESASKAEGIDWIVLSGGGSLIPYLPEYIQEKLSIPVEIFNPLRNIKFDAAQFPGLQAEKMAPLMAVPIGLACRKVL